MRRIVCSVPFILSCSFLTSHTVLFSKSSASFFSVLLLASLLISWLNYLSSLSLNLLSTSSSLFSSISILLWHFLLLTTSCFCSLASISPPFLSTLSFDYTFTHLLSPLISPFFSYGVAILFLLMFTIDVHSLFATFSLFFSPWSSLSFMLSLSLLHFLLSHVLLCTKSLPFFPLLHTYTT